MNPTFEITTDKDLIQGFLLNPRAFVRMANDDGRHPRRSDLDKALKCMWFCVARVDGLPVALFVIQPLTPESAEVHFCFSPSEWGRTKPICEQFLEWVWANSTAQALCGPVPAYNRLALSLALSCGFKEYHREQGAVKKNGKKYDLIQTRLERPAAA